MGITTDTSTRAYEWELPEGSASPLVRLVSCTLCIAEERLWAYAFSSVAYPGRFAGLVFEGGCVDSAFWKSAEEDWTIWIFIERSRHSFSGVRELADEVYWFVLPHVQLVFRVLAHFGFMWTEALDTFLRPGRKNESRHEQQRQHDNKSHTHTHQ